MSKINWFPGHMARATNDIKDTKPLDLIIEVIDARAINTSRNSDLIKLINKPKMTVALKEDLADAKSLNIPDDVMVLSIKDGDAKEQILYQLNKFFADKIDKLKTKGLLVPQFYMLVLGLPNVGKSSLINACSEYGSRAIVQNKPGVTKRKQLIKISDNFFLYDTPGIMVKKVDTDEQGYILSLLNVIKKDVIPLEDTCEWAYNFFMLKYREQFVSYFKIPTHVSFSDFIDFLCRRFNFYKMENLYDKERGMDYFLNLIKDGKICRVNYEKN